MYSGIVGGSGNNQPRLTHSAEQNTPANPAPSIRSGSNPQETDPRLNIDKLSKPNQNSLQSDIPALNQLGKAIKEAIKPLHGENIASDPAELKHIKTLLKKIFTYSLGISIQEESLNWKELKKDLMDVAYGPNNLQELPDILQELSDIHKVLLSMPPPENLSREHSQKITKAKERVLASENLFQERQKKFNKLKQLHETPQYPLNVEITGEDRIPQDFQIKNPLAEIEVQNPLLKAIILEFKDSVALKSSELFVNPNPAKELKENLLELAQKLDNISTSKLGLPKPLSAPETVYFTGCSMKPPHIQITNSLNKDERFKLDSQLLEIITTKALEHFKTISSTNNSPDTVTINTPANEKPTIYLSFSKETKQESDFLKIQITNTLESKKPQYFLSRLLPNRPNSQLKNTEILTITDPLLKTAQQLLENNDGKLNFLVQKAKNGSETKCLEILYPLGGKIS
jgi:hypothetical protein